MTQLFQTDDGPQPQQVAQLEPSESIDTMYLTFPVGSELYGVSISVVTEIVGLQKIMSVPDVPHYIKGVINLRGKVIPLMDVHRRFGMAEKPLAGSAGCVAG
jgi:purine-binding chemotaxis protein CheW